LDKDGLAHADSFGHSANPKVLGIVQWILADMGYPSPSSIREVAIAQQNSGGVGSGSCGVAAHDFILSPFPAQEHTSRWTSSRSPHFHDHALINLITFHHTASKSNVVCHHALKVNVSC